MKRLEIVVIAVGVLISTVLFSQAALACMDHEEWPEPSEAPPAPTLGQEGDYCEFQDGDCAEGFECMGLPCKVTPCDVDDTDCIEGETQCPMGGICSATVVEPSCETDADCADGLTCAHYEAFCPTPVVECTPDDDDCEPIEPVDCEQGWLGVCEEVINKPGQCSTDADCDSEAYTCKFAEECDCTDGFIVIGERDEPTEEENCTCTTSEIGYCQLVEKTCDTDADCTGVYEGFDCVDIRPPGLCFIDSESGEEWCSEDEGSKQCVSTSIAPPPGKNFPDTNNNGQETGSESASGGCTIGHGAGAGGAVLPMLVLLMGWITRRRFTATH
jgi:hypothetical protein